MGSSCWELYCQEHGIAQDGFLKTDTVQDENYFETFFYETTSNRYVPRTILIDLEPTVVGKLDFFFVFLIKKILTEHCSTKTCFILHTAMEFIR